MKKADRLGLKCIASPNLTSNCLLGLWFVLFFFFYKTRYYYHPTESLSIKMKSYNMFLNESYCKVYELQCRFIIKTFHMKLETIFITTLQTRPVRKKDYSLSVYYVVLLWLLLDGFQAHLLHLLVLCCLRSSFRRSSRPDNLCEPWPLAKAWYVLSISIH